MKLPGRRLLGNAQSLLVVAVLSYPHCVLTVRNGDTLIDGFPVFLLN